MEVLLGSDEGASVLLRQLCFRITVTIVTSIFISVVKTVNRLDTVMERAH